MKTKINYLIQLLLICITNLSIAQNLVVNGSFEQNTGFPNALNQFGLCSGWSNPTWPTQASPDYFHTSGSGDAGAPVNCMGTGIFPQDGEAYAGIITYATSSGCGPSFMFREYIMGALSSAMVPFVPYHISFYVQNATPGLICATSVDDYATNNLGIAFVMGGFTENTLIGCSGFRNITGASPVVYPVSNTVVTSVGGWTLISMDFTPSLAYTNFIIGNFADNAGTLVNPPADPWTNNRAYYYIDNVSISRFDCNKCNCKKDAMMDHFWVDADGNSGVDVHVDGGGQWISKFRITLVNYKPKVDEECLKCDVSEQHKFGTVTGAPDLYHESPIFATYNPNAGPDFSREVTWCFPQPVQFGSQTVSLRLKFPPILNLPCCKNADDFCIRIEFWTNECLACDLLICNNNESEPGHERQPNRITEPSKKPDSGQIKLIPNPASNNFKVVIPKENINGVVQVYDLSGSLLKEFKTSSEEYTVNTKSYPAGTYIVRYKNANTSFEEKLIIKR